MDFPIFMIIKQPYSMYQCALWTLHWWPNAFNFTCIHQMFLD